MKNAGENAIDSFYESTCRMSKEEVIRKDFQKIRIIMTSKKVGADR